MHLDRAHAQPKPVRGLFVVNAFHEDRDGFAFSRGQLRHPEARLITGGENMFDAIEDIKALRDGPIERVGLDWLLEKIDRTELHRPHRGCDVPMCGQDYDRPGYLQTLEHLQKLQAIDIRHPDIQQDRRRGQKWQLLQKILHGRERANIQI